MQYSPSTSRPVARRCSICHLWSGMGVSIFRFVGSLSTGIRLPLTAAVAIKCSPLFFGQGRGKRNTASWINRDMFRLMYAEIYLPAVGSVQHVSASHRDSRLSSGLVGRHFTFQGGHDVRKGHVEQKSHKGHAVEQRAKPPPRSRGL